MDFAIGGFGNNQCEGHGTIASVRTYAVPGILSGDAANIEQGVIVRIWQLSVAEGQHIGNIVGWCHENRGVRLYVASVGIGNEELVGGGGVKSHDSGGGCVAGVPIEEGSASTQCVIPEQIVLQTTGGQGDSFAFALDILVGQDGHVRYIHNQKRQGDGAVAAGLGDVLVNEHRVLFLHAVDVKTVTVVRLSDPAHCV